MKHNTDKITKQWQKHNACIIKLNNKWVNIKKNLQIYIMLELKYKTIFIFR